METDGALRCRRPTHTIKKSRSRAHGFSLTKSKRRRRRRAGGKHAKRLRSGQGIDGKQIIEDFGRIDILVNNAGITRDGLMMRMSEQQWDMVINVNLKSAFNFIHACTPIMMRQKAGSIINMASVVGVHGNAGQANYSASKAGMIALAKSIAQELGSRGIRANAIAPGFIMTAMTDALSEEVKAEWCKKIPLRRGGTPEDVANIATFLASDMSSYVSGQVIQVDGGMNM